MRPQVKLLQDRPFLLSVAPGNAAFNNSMRVGYGGIVANSNADFFKMASTKKTRSTVQMNGYGDLTNAEGAFKETLLGYISDATNDNESAFDPLMVMILLIL
jgi:hypothetical protein